MAYGTARYGGAPYGGATSAGALSATVNQATETDTANAVTWAPKIRVIGQAAETDTADTISRRGVIAQALETDAAQVVTARKTTQVGQATETDIAQVVTWAPKVRLIGQAAENDTAQTITHTIIRLLGQAVETDIPQTVTARKRKTIGQATETDLALTRFSITTWIDAQYDYARDRDGLEVVLSLNPPTVPPPDDLTALATPSQPTLTAVAGTGLTAGTYSYRVAAYRHDVSQITLPSPAANITISTPNLRVQVEWPPVANASGYVVFAAPGASPADSAYQEVGRT